MGVRVLSLFDGISVGYSALIREGFAIEKYYASEIDRFAIAVSAANHPDIVQVGCIKALDTRALAELGRIDILLAAPPCQGFSPAGKRHGFGHAQSRLYYDFLRVLREVKPTWFLIENVASPQLIEALKSDLGGDNADRHKLSTRKWPKPSESIFHKHRACVPTKRQRHSPE